MLRRVACAAIAALALVVAPAAFADGGPSPGVLLGSDGLLAAGGSVRYVALPATTDTALAAVRTRDGFVLRFTSLVGTWGIPYVTGIGDAGGLSVDGSTLVLANSSQQCCGLQTDSSFLVLQASNFKEREFVRLHGDFSYDALSPNGSTLYLIQHVSKADLTKYVVRAYDLVGRRLLPRVIADRTQRGWVMAGYPMSRATSPDGRWVYTLYQRTGGTPFVHALDSVRGVAHCIGIPWTGSQNGFWNLRLSLRDGGRTLAIHWLSGRGYLLMDTRTWRLSPPGGGFPWWAILLAAAAALALVGAVSRGSLRRPRRSVPVLASAGSGPIAALHDARPEPG